MPQEDLSSVERELFHFEEALWFYTDFVKLMNPSLPNMKIKSFANYIIESYPVVWKWDLKAKEALTKFSNYKKTIPVRGAAIFNRKLNKLLLVKGTESDSWSFPRGKISKDEDDIECCIREVKEEIGFDITDYIDSNQFVERNIQMKNYKIYLVKDVPEDFDFKPQVRNEIDKIEWKDFKKVCKAVSRSPSNHSHSSNKFYLVNSMIKPLQIWVAHQRRTKNITQMKAEVEEELKIILGLSKGEPDVDPGRDLLNMLQQASDQKSSLKMPNGEDNSTFGGSFEQSDVNISTNPHLSPINQSMAGNSGVLNNTNIIPSHLVYQQHLVTPTMLPPTDPKFYNQTNVPFMGPPPAFMPLDNNYIQPSNHVTTAPPNMESLSKPTFYRDSTSSKQLLDILHSKAAPTDECNINKTSTSRATESLRKADTQKEIPEPAINNDRSTYTLEDSVSEASDNYEDFESISGEDFNDDSEYEDDFKDAKQSVDEASIMENNFEDNENLEYNLHDALPEKVDKLQSPTLNKSPMAEIAKASSQNKSTSAHKVNDDLYEGFDSSEEENEIEENKLKILGTTEQPDYSIIKPFDIIRDNNFRHGEVPHKDAVSDTLKSVASSNMTQLLLKSNNASTVSLNSNPALSTGQIKLLKRGEKIKNHSLQDKETNSNSQNLLDILKRPPNQKGQNNTDGMDGKPKITLLKRKKEDSTGDNLDSINRYDNFVSGKGTGNQMQQTSHPLRDIHNATKEHKISISHDEMNNGKELLNLLKKPSTQAPLAAEKRHSNNAPENDQSGYSSQIPNDINPLLNLLKRPNNNPQQENHSQIITTNEFHNKDKISRNKHEDTKSEQRDNAYVGEPTNPLLQVLNDANRTKINDEVSYQNPEIGSNDLLNMLKNPSQQTSQIPDDMGHSNELLNLLKRPQIEHQSPTNNNLIPEKDPHNPVNDLWSMLQRTASPIPENYDVIKTLYTKQGLQNQNL